MKKRMIAMIASTAVTVVAAVVIVSAIPAPQQPRTDKPAVRASDTVAAPSTATKPGTVLIGTTDAENETKPVDPAAIEAIDPDDYPFPIMIAEASNMGYGLYAERLKQLKNDK